VELVVTTYELLSIEGAALGAVPWRQVVVDEARRPKSEE